MRYTTVIDITNLALYRNQNARLVYLHLCLVAGYHDNDRDLVALSIRNLAWRVGLTLSATRHAIAQLTAAGLVKREGPTWRVNKWIQEGEISKRRQMKSQARIAAARAEDQAALDAQFEKQRQMSERLERQGKTSFMVYYESLQEKAAAGDPEAAEKVRKYKQTYDSHSQAVASKKSTNK